MSISMILTLKNWFYKQKLIYKSCWLRLKLYIIQIWVGKKKMRK